MMEVLETFGNGNPGISNDLLKNHSNKSHLKSCNHLRQEDVNRLMVLESNSWKWCFANGVLLCFSIHVLFNGCCT